MARSSMAALITRLRRTVGDPAGASQVFTDDELQDALDAHRVEARLVPLSEIESVAAGGTVSYLEYMAPVGAWEDSVVLQDGSYATVTPDGEDLLAGRWTFDASQDPPLYATGQAYDLAGAAVEVLEAWLAKVKADFDFSTDNQQFRRSQKAATIERLLTVYQRRARGPMRRLVAGGAGF